MLLASSRAEAVKVEVDKDTYLDFHLLLQPWAQFRYSDPNDNPNVQHAFGDFYMRRTRIVVGGQLTKWISFFAETDMPNWGMGGDWKTSTFFVQDAYMQFNLHESFNIVGGMILTPFIHNASQGATSLHGLDYHVDLMKYPTQANKVWRDMGVMFRGFLFKKKLDYRIAFTNGVQDGAEVVAAKAATATAPAVPAVLAATGESPRFSGRIAYNIFDAEEGFFLAGTYLGKKKVLSLGFAYDLQPGVYGKDAGTGNKRNYWALGGDVFWDLPMGKNRLSGQFDYVGYGGISNATRGQGFLFDVGYAIGKIEPIFAIDWYRQSRLLDATGTEVTGFKKDLFGLHVGINWWFLGHTANLKLDYGQIKAPGLTFGKSASVITLQTQLYL
jgi:hypothetical protein